MSECLFLWEGLSFVLFFSAYVLCYLLKGVCYIFCYCIKKKIIYMNKQNKKISNNSGCGWPFKCKNGYTVATLLVICKKRNNFFLFLFFFIEIIVMVAVKCHSEQYIAHYVCYKIPLSIIFVSHPTPIPNSNPPQHFFFFL